MEFVVYRCRHEGVVLARHVMWSTKVTGDLFVAEEHDAELSRAVRVARLKDPEQKELVAPLHDVQIISAKPDWWTFTGWELVQSGFAVKPRAYQQSWILIPADKA